MKKAVFAGVFLVITFVVATLGGTKTQAQEASTEDYETSTSLPMPEIVSCPEGEYPQDYGPEAPCGPIDPCVSVDQATGIGATLWAVTPCAVSVATSAPPTEHQQLPETGSATFGIFFIAAVCTLLGLAFYLGSIHLRPIQIKKGTNGGQN